MSKENRAEKEFARGMDALTRGRNDQAEIRFQRAAKAGINVAERLQAVVGKDLEEFKQKVDARRQKPKKEEVTVEKTPERTEKININTTSEDATSLGSGTEMGPEKKNEDSEDGKPKKDGGYWRAVTDCDGNTFSVWAQGVTL